MIKGMELIFLGTGTSTGVPMIGCHCSTCSSSDRRDNRLRASALLKTAGQNILIDCGPDLRTQMLENNVDRLDCCLITHSHYDHVGGIDDLRPFCYPNGFDIYCKRDVEKSLREHVPYCFAKKPYPGAPVLHPHEIKPFVRFKVGETEFTPLPVNHYQMDILGFRTGDFAYITDAKIVPVETIEALRGTKTLVINALRHKEHISHMNLKQALDVIKEVRPEKAYLTHISHDMGLHAEVAPTLPNGVELAYDGLKINL